MQKEKTKKDKKIIMEPMKKRLIFEFGQVLKSMAHDKDGNTTQVLVKIMEEIYGHSVPIGKLIELIETSPLRK